MREKWMRSAAHPQRYEGKVDGARAPSTIVSTGEDLEKRITRGYLGPDLKNSFEILSHKISTSDFIDMLKNPPIYQIWGMISGRLETSNQKTVCVDRKVHDGCPFGARSVASGRAGVQNPADKQINNRVCRQM